MRNKLPMSSPAVQSPFVPLQIPRRSPRRQTRQQTIAPKRVYGKRKTNVPRAVFEVDSANGAHTSPETGDDIEQLIGEVGEKLKAVEIGKVESREDGPEQDESEETRFERNTEAIPECSITRDEIMEEVLEKMVEVRIIEANNGDGYSESKEHLQRPPEEELPEEKPQEEKPRPKKKEKERRTHRTSTGCIQDIKTNTYVRPILDEVMSGTRAVQKFSSWATYGEDKFDVEKIAEGSYGEVYQLHLREEAIPKGSISKSRLARLRAYGDGVFKIVPIRAQRGVGSKKFTTVSEIVSEVQMLKLLDEVPGFARFREVHVVQGRFPPKYQAAWWEYRDTKDDCLNPDPAKKASYPDTQLWAILEMNNAGCELEKFAWSTTFQIYDIFWGVAMALARAEQLAGFEVRTLRSHFSRPKDKLTWR